MSCPALRLRCSALRRVQHSLLCSSQARSLSQASRSIKPLTHSIVSGPLDPPLVELTLPAYYKEHILANHASRPALISRHELNIRWTFAELDAQVEKMARGLLTAGVKPGDRVATILGNCSAYAVLQWACARMGAVLVTMNPAYKMHEIISALNNVTASTLILTPSMRKSPFLKLVEEALPTLSSTPAGKDINDPGLPSLRRLFVVDNTGDRSQFLAHMERIPCAVDLAEVANARYGVEPAKAAGVSASMDPHDIVNLQFTSGTTGLPKAVSLTHRNLLNNGLSIGRCMRLSSQDVVCNVPPLFHCFGLVLGNLAAWVHGAAIVYASESFDPKAIVRTVSDEKCTALHGVPTHFIGVLEELERLGPGSDVNMTSLRTGIAAGSPIPIDLMHQLIARLNLNDLTIAYGMTETSPVSFQTTPDDPLEMRVETVGRVQPHVRAKIIDEHGNLTPIGTPGELCIAGYLVQKGYWENPEQTNAVMKRDEKAPDTLWMHPGDQATIDKEGYMRIVGRIKDLIIRGGENLSPVQIENCLTLHPDIVEAAVIAIPDARFGEVVGAWILLRKGAATLGSEDVVNWVKGRMNPQNAPSRVWFLNHEGAPAELPKTASGKVMKNVLRTWAKGVPSEKQSTHA
ncbi:acyl-CoA synthetase [Ceratobasidium sp. AG-I]|nr:acyl-CoA synthetase [Ceratobasidium sp. AG-I]